MGCTSSSIAVAPSAATAAAAAATVAQPAPAAAEPNLFESIGLALGDKLRAVLERSGTEPWPRHQECGEVLEHDEPLPEDLVLCVSHGWPYQAHPDPLGEKAPPMQALLDQAAEAHKPAGRTLVFLDFLSVTQRPRTEQEDAAFRKALGVMPKLYCHADAVLHIDTLGSAVDGDGDEFEATLADLDGARLLQFGGAVQVLSCASAAVPDLSVVRRIGGASVMTIEDVHAARSAAGTGTGTGAASPPVILRRAPFGMRNDTPCAERGWVFLERFCSMVKVAMCEEEAEVARVAFSNSEGVLQEIRQGGRRLRDAAKAGETALSATLDDFVATLLQKRFAGASVDAATGGAREGYGGGGGARRHSVQLSGDALVVANLMKELAAHLPAHWEQEKAAQRQRALVLAVHRGDAGAVTALCAAGADPNAADARGKACLHAAALRADEPVSKALLDAGARTDAADDEGNLPAHFVPLWASEDTVTLLSLLGRSAPLGLLNKAGVSVYDRLVVWAVTASEGKPYAPAKDLADQWLAADPALLAGDADDGGAEELDAAQLAQITASARTDFTTPVLTYAHPDATLDIVMFYMMPGLPYPVEEPQVEHFCRSVACYFKARVLLVRHAPRSSQSSLAEFHSDLLGVVNKLEIRGDKFGVITCMQGSSVGILWELAPRVAFALCINPGGYWAKDYIDSPAHQGFAGVMAKYSSIVSGQGASDNEHGAWWSGGKMDAITAQAAAVCCFAKDSGVCQNVANTIIDAYGVEANAPDVAANLRHWSCALRWQVRDYADHMRDRSALAFPGAVLASAFGPATLLLDCADRFQKEKFLRGTLNYIPRSKSWVFSPPEVQIATRTIMRTLKALHAAYQA